MRLFATVLAFAGLCLAQEKASPYQFVPKDACVVMRLAGPGAWHDQFAKTQVQKLLLGPTALPMRQALEKSIDEAMDAVRQEGKIDADLLRKALTDYAGDMVFALQVDFSTLESALQTDTSPRMAIVVSFGPDGHTDLAALAAQIEKAAEGGEQKLTDLKVGDRTLRMGGDEKMQVCVPTILEGSLVLIAGSELDKQAEGLISGKGDHFTPPTLRTQGPMAVHVDLGPAIAALMQLAAAQMEQGGAPFDVVKMMTSFGLASLNRFDMALGADGKYLAAEFGVGFNDKPRGLFGMIPPDHKGAPKLLELLPANAENFSVSALDLGALYRMAASIWDEIGPMVGTTREDAESAFAEQCKVRLKEDLLDHLGKEMIAVQDLREGLEAQAAAIKDEDQTASVAAAFSGNCLGLSLANGKAFGESLEKLIRARGLHAGRKTEDYAGCKVHRLNLFAVVEIEYAVTDDLLLLAMGKGESARRNLRAILDERAARAEGKKAAGLPEVVKERLSLLPEGWSGISVTPITSWLSAISAAANGFNAGMGGGGEEAAEVQHVLEVIGSLQGEMRQLGLEHMVGTQYVDKSSFRAYMRW